MTGETLMELELALEMAKRDRRSAEVTTLAAAMVIAEDFEKARLNTEGLRYLSNAVAELKDSTDNALALADRVEAARNGAAPRAPNDP